MLCPAYLDNKAATERFHCVISLLWTEIETKNRCDSEYTKVLFHNSNNDSSQKLKLFISKTNSVARMSKSTNNSLDLILSVLLIQTISSDASIENGCATGFITIVSRRPTFVLLSNEIQVNSIIKRQHQYVQ